MVFFDFSKEDPAALPNPPYTTRDCELLSAAEQRIGGKNMIIKFFKSLFTQEDGQGLVEYTLILLLVLFVFWLGVKDSNIGSQIAAAWSNIANCVGAPFSCSVS